ncbi:MAG: methyltransferase domain-containing protein, partial [Saprospiraceae bacterium]
ATRDRMEVRMADRNDPNLRDGEADVIMMVNTFMYIENQEDYLRLLKKKLKPGGQLLIVDFKRKRTPIGPNAKLRLPLFELEDMLLAAGYRLERSDDRSLDYQYVIRASI